MPHREAYAQAKTSALRALALDDACADAQVALGTVLFLSEWDWVGAEKSLRRALEINSASLRGLAPLRQPDGGAWEAGSRTAVQTAGARARSAVAARSGANRQLVLASTAVRRCDRVGEQGTRNRSAASAGRRIPRRRLLETRRHRPFLAENLTRAEVFGVSEPELAGIKRVASRSLKAVYASDETRGRGAMPGR